MLNSSAASACFAAVYSRFCKVSNALPSQDFPEGQSRQIGVQGKADQVLRAVQMINELIQGEPGSAQAIIQKVTWQDVSC
jgi:hypothetical protein